MTAYDAVGLVGTALILATYAATVAGRADPRRAAALAGNLLGASLILVSLAHDFNLSAAIVEGAWAVIALVGLVRLALRPSAASIRRAAARSGVRRRDA